MVKLCSRAGWRAAQFLLGLSLGWLGPGLLLSGGRAGGGKGGGGPAVWQSHAPTPPPAPPPIPLFVGVMTARPYLAGRACSVWRSWGARVAERGGQIRFFVGEAGEVGPGRADGGNWCGLPLVTLPVPDTAYPPQQKSFAMLAWMADQVGPRSHWFLRADDDVFVKVDALLEFLRPINSSTPHYLGQAGVGRGLEEGKLELRWNQNFCMGGPGVLLSRATLVALRPEIPACLASLLTSHEDVEVGRCVARATGQSCSWAYDMRTYFYHSPGGKEDKGAEVEPGALNARVLHHALTVHPLKKPRNMELLAARVGALERTELRSRAERAALLADQLAGQAEQESLAGLEGAWDLILSHKLYSLGAGAARRKVPAHLAEGLTRVVGHVLDVINAEASEKGREIEFRDLFYAYVHRDPEQGLTYILDLLLLYKRYRGNKMTVKVRRHVYVRQPFLPAAVQSVGQEESGVGGAVGGGAPSALLMSGDGAAAPARLPDSRQLVTFIVPVAGEKKIPVVKRFLENYDAAVLSQLQPARLVMVVFREHEQDTQMEAAVRQAVAALESNYPGYNFTVVVLSQTFSRGIGMMEGIRLCHANELLFLLDVDIQFSGNVLDLMRSFTKPGQQVYYPIVKSMFKGEQEGYWRDFGFGIMSAYRSDIDRTAGFNTSIVGWGKEDVDLFTKFLSTNLTMFRAVEPQLVHRYHEVNCAASLPTAQADMCRSSRASNYLPLHTLADLVLNSSLLNG